MGLVMRHVMYIEWEIGALTSAVPTASYIFAQRFLLLVSTNVLPTGSVSPNLCHCLIRMAGVIELP